MQPGTAVTSQQCRDDGHGANAHTADGEQHYAGVDKEALTTQHMSYRVVFNDLGMLQKYITSRQQAAMTIYLLRLSFSLSQIKYSKCEASQTVLGRTFLVQCVTQDIDVQLLHTRGGLEGSG